ncbi:polyprenyl synthetase family protein, partial [Streptomyces sp. SID6013]|nr:polyprenyl synthetase family protein [Streptomyces sp. SID6013]
MTEIGSGATVTRRSTGTPETHGPIGTQRDNEPGESSGGQGQGPVAEGHEAAVLLRESRASVDPELRSAIASLPDRMRRIALYHFGWQHADGTPATGNAGKAIRPALVLTAATALGGPA